MEYRVFLGPNEYTVISKQEILSLVSVLNAKERRNFIRFNNISNISNFDDAVALRIGDKSKQLESIAYFEKTNVHVHGAVVTE
jgi:hypothetical protein